MANQRIIVITNRDNVATALEPLAAGDTVSIHERTIVVRNAIANGHKVALERIASGEPILKYGNPIGVASQDIEAGEHVHTHNVASTRGRGDLSPTTAREKKT